MVLNTCTVSACGPDSGYPLLKSDFSKLSMRALPALSVAIIDESPSAHVSLVVPNYANVKYSHFVTFDERFNCASACDPLVANILYSGEPNFGFAKSPSNVCASTIGTISKIFIL